MTRDLLSLTKELVEIPSTSGDETLIANRVEDELSSHSHLEITRIGNNVVARTNADRSSRVILAGHLDTVVGKGGAKQPHCEILDDGETLVGLGAADMKGGLAVMLDLADTLYEPSVDITWCLYAREEIARTESGLLEIRAVTPDLLVADVAILGEPTACLVEAGCQGTMRAVLRLGGVRAHTARPFVGINAIHRLPSILQKVANWGGREVTIDGCKYAEQLQSVGIEGGVGANVVPDEVSLTLNHRFAPDRSIKEARRAIAKIFEDDLTEQLGDTFQILDAADGALPSLDHWFLARVVEESGTSPKAKVGWTDVASFSQAGVPALNFGPGDPMLAHHPDERVTRATLEKARSTLQKVFARDAL